LYIDILKNPVISESCK